MQSHRLYRTGRLRVGLLGACLGSVLSAACQSLPTAATPPVPASAPTGAELAARTHEDYTNMLHQLGIEHMRPGASGSPTGPNAANYDDAKVLPYTLPDPLLLTDGKPVHTAKVWWGQRRPQLVHLLEDSMYGQVPANTPGVTWTVLSTTTASENGISAITRKLRGHVDNSADPAIAVDIQVELTLPRAPHRSCSRDDCLRLAA